MLDICILAGHYCCRPVFVWMGAVFIGCRSNKNRTAAKWMRFNMFIFSVLCGFRERASVKA
jgi:hypothetical protein